MNEEQKNPQENAPQEQNREEQEGERVASTLMKILAIVGLIAVLALAAWLSIQAIRYSPTAWNTVSSTISSAAVTLNSIFSPNGGDELELSLESTVFHSGEPTTISFEHDGMDATYTFSFACVDNLRFRIQEENGEYTTVTCEEPYEFSGRSELRMIPVSETARFVDTTVTVAVAGDEDATASAEVTIVNESVAEEPNGETPSNGGSPSTGGTSGGQTGTPSQPSRPARPTGPADLAIRVIGTGIVLEEDGERTFYQAPSVPADQKGAIRFVVENVGGQRAAEWDFVATLPTKNDPFFRYDAPTQQALNPGDRIEFTLGFDALEENEDARITISVRPGGADASATNNVASAAIPIREAE